MNQSTSEATTINCPCLAKYVVVDVGRGIISLNFPHAALVWESAFSSQPPPR